MKIVKYRPLIILLIFLQVIQTAAQNFQRVAPQVTNSTILIDRNTDKAKLKAQLLYAAKNYDNEDYQVALTLFEGLMNVTQELKESINIKTSGNRKFYTNDDKSFYTVDQIRFKKRKCEIAIGNKTYFIQSINKEKSIPEWDGTQFNHEIQFELKSQEVEIDKEQTLTLFNVTKIAVKIDGVDSEYTYNNTIDKVSSSSGLDKYKIIQSNEQRREGYDNVVFALELLVSFSKSHNIRIEEKLKKAIEDNNRLNLYTDIKKVENIKSRCKETIDMIFAGTFLSNSSKFLKKINNLLATAGSEALQFRYNRPNQTLNENIKALVGLIINAASIIEIPEADRLRATAEIIFSLQHLVEGAQFSLTNQKVTIHLGLIKITIPDGTDTTNFEFLLKFLGKCESILKDELNDRLSYDDPAIKFFDRVYSKILLATTDLKNANVPGLHEIVDAMVSDYRLIYNGEKDKTKFKTQLGRSIEFSIENRVEKANDFARIYYVNTFLDLLGNNIAARVREAFKNPSKVSWINNFNINDSITEISTTIAYRPIITPRFQWECTGNYFYNNLGTDSIVNIQDTTTYVKIRRFTSRILLGSNFKYAFKSNRQELALYMAASIDVVSGIRHIDETKPNLYIGFWWAFKNKTPGLIWRIYFEAMLLRPANETDFFRKTLSYNTGIDIKFPETFLLNGALFNYNKDLGFSLGIKLPVIQ